MSGWLGGAFHAKLAWGTGFFAFLGVFAPWREIREWEFTQSSQRSAKFRKGEGILAFLGALARNPGRLRVRTDL